MLISKKATLILSVIFTLTTVLCSCGNDDNEDYVEPTKADNTIFVFMPWTQSINSALVDNVNDMLAGIKANGGLGNDKLVLFVSSSATKANLIQILYKDNQCVRDTLKTYTNPDYTTTTGLSSIMNEVASKVPGNKYSMIIGCHALGWVSIDAWAKLPQYYPASSAKRYYTSSFSYENSSPITRALGGDSEQYQLEISTLSDAISNSNIKKLQYIIFDNCYMANMEVAYQLKDVTNYIIGSTCEILTYGIPYSKIWTCITGTLDYQGVCDGYKSYYSSDAATLSAINCSEAENMAYIMKEINKLYTYDTSDNIQILDGLPITVFFDMGDYVKHLCKDNTTLYSSFETELSKLVPYYVSTGKFYSEFNNKTTTITSYSGISISDPSQNPVISTEKLNTSWYSATH